MIQKSEALTARSHRCSPVLYYSGMGRKVCLCWFYDPVDPMFFFFCFFLVCVAVFLRPINPMGSVYLTTLLLGRLSPLSD